MSKKEKAEHEHEHEHECKGEVTRRRFLGLVGASATLAGLTPLAGCIRQPEEHIFPYADRPEDLIPGKPRYYATSAMIGGGVLGLLVESQDGRPTKMEGHPSHPMNHGSASAWAQAEVLSLYDPGRSRLPRLEGKEVGWDDFTDFAGQYFGSLRQRGGAGLSLLIEHRPSPTYQRLLRELRQSMPRAALYLHDQTFSRQTLEGISMIYRRGLPVPALDRADLVLALDSDFLGTEPDTTRKQMLYARRRQVLSPQSTMNRLYVVEPALTITGAAADHRLPLRSSEVERFLEQLLAELVAQKMKLPAGAEALRHRLPARRAGARFGKWIPALARDLLSHRGTSLVLVGERQPPRVHALGLLLNAALKALGRTMEIVEQPEIPEAGTLEGLCAALRAGKVQTLLVLGGDPTYQAPPDLEFPRLLRTVPERIHLSSRYGQTSRLCRWHLPLSHFLEAWGDWRAVDGSVSLQQPLIAPLHASRSEIEVLAQVLGSKTTRGYELVRQTWQNESPEPDFEKRWRRWLHDGLMGPPPPRKPAAAPPSFSFGKLLASEPASVPDASPQALEASFHLDYSVLDGRYSANPWLQELPDPISKLTWDNAACLAPATAAALGVKSFDLVELDFNGPSLTMPALIVPGTVENTVVLPLGYGHRADGEIAKAGFDVGRLRSSRAPWFGAGLRLRRVGRRYALAITQEHSSMEGRPLVREATIDEYRADPERGKKLHVPLRSLWKDPVSYTGRQWGMSIDLSVCTGCSACSVACQAENNIPVVGKRQVIANREMHWLRVDRYFVGAAGNPQVRFQPLPCMQCENAPCEQVCPVMATVHSPEGLNDQAYNRCIGTRYCSNNCPFKVRHFNFFQYNKGIDPLLRMQKNPDVTLRFRGVMEKCTYCVQRIQEAKIQQKVKGTDLIPDGMVMPACAQTCPSGAIVFGDINDVNSLVAHRKREPRSYGLLTELNLRTRTTYLAKLRNPNPELGDVGGSESGA